MCNMDDLMRAVIRTFHDVNLRVELVPQRSSDLMPVNTGTTPTRGRDDSMQAVDDQYATVYRVNHCKLTPTSPSPWMTEFPPQRAELLPGRDNFQVGGTGSGETGPLPNKSSCYRGGLSWTSREAVYSPRVSHTTDRFASSLRKYPPSFENLPSFEHCSVLGRLDKSSRTRNRRSTRSSPSSPTRRHQIPDTLKYEKESNDTLEYPTRDWSDASSRGKTYTKQEHINYILNVSKTHWNKPKSISAYTHAQTAAWSNGYDVTTNDWYTARQESTKVDHRAGLVTGMRRLQVNKPVQAVTQKISKEIETVPLPVPSRRTIAIPPSSSSISSVASLPTLTIHVSPITRSVQTIQLSGIPAETTTSSIEIAKHDYGSVIAKKSKSFSEFKLEHDFKSQVLEWLDDGSDPKTKEFQEMVLTKLTRRLKKIRVPDTERIKVKMADCVKSRLKMRSIGELTNKINGKQEPCGNKCNIFRAAINSSLTTDECYIEDVIKEWLSNICIKKRDILNRPVKKHQIFNTIVNKLKNLVVKQSKHCREHLLREEIMEMLEEIPIEVNSRDKTNYLELVANDLIYRLENVSRDDTEIKSCKYVKSEKLNIYETKTNLLPTDKQERECGVKEIADAFKNRSMVNSELLKEKMIDFKDILTGSVCPNGGVEEILNLLNNAVKLPESESIQCAIKLTDDRRHILHKKYINHAAVLQFSVFMLQLLSKNNIFKPSESQISQNSINSNVDNDIEANLNQYKIQLGKQIERWLSNLTILQTCDKDCREAAVFDLVNDIVDRQKYLEIKKNKDSDMDELEHLKYMIFKWTKRIIGEENMDTVGHAAELMEMLRSIPVPILAKSHEQLYAPNSVFRVSSNNHSALSTNMSMNKNVSRAKINSRVRRPINSRNRYKGNRNGSVCTNYLVHKLSKKAVKSSGQVPPSSNQGKTMNNQSGTSNNKSDSSKLGQKNRKNSQGPKLKICDDKVCDTYSGATRTGAKNDIHNNEVRSGNDVERSLLNLIQHNNQNPGPSGLVTPKTASTEKGSSATSKLMADWRPPPIYTPRPSGKPRLEIVHDEFQKYLQNWSKQIPIPATNSEEEKTAEQARLGILKGIWKMITKLKTQPAVYQNKFYYEDVLGKEIDELLNCLPQTQELKEKRYMLKVQLLEKTTAMNELVQDLEMPDNYKEILARDLLEKQNERIRKVVKLNNENPTIMFEQMFKYCVLDDFLLKSNYKEHDKIKDKAYKIKLMEKIQEYVDELKTTYGKELEDLFSVVHENDIIRILDNVPLPSDESVKENADEIFLGLEIEQWMMDLPIVNNNDSAEQRHRRRLRDALTKKLLEMDKYANVPSCCEETQVRHEISIFLDKVPLEQDEDLNINDMVDDLTKRFKNRHVASDRRKSVAFQNRQQNQQKINETGKLHQSQFTNKWNHEEDGVPRYSAFYKNGLLCSTRLEPPGDEWAMEEGQDAQYRALFKDRPVCSSMIEPQAAYGIDEAPRLPDFRHPNEQEPIFTYIPGQFHESARGGSFRYPPRGSVPYNDGRYQYPEPSMMSRYGPSAPKFYDSQGNSIRDYPLPSHVDNQYRSIPGVHDRQSIPPMMQPAMNHIQPRGDFEGQSDASGGFVSMMEHNPQSPMRNTSDQRFSNARQQSFNSHRSGINASLPQDVAPAGFLTSIRNEQSLIEPHPQAPFYPDASVFSNALSNQTRWNEVEVDPNMQPQMMQPFNQPREFEDQNEASGGFVSMIEHGQQSPARSRSEQFRASRGSNQYRQNSVEIDSNGQQEPVEEFIHKTSRFSRELLKDQNSYRGIDADMLPPDPGAEGEFVSMRSHQSRDAVQAPSAPLETSARNQSTRQSNRFSKHQLEPIFETAPEPFLEAPRSEPGVINQSRNTNRSAHNTQVSNRSLRNVLIRDSVPTTHEAVSRSPAVSPQSNARGIRASNVPTEISNHPVGFSTPNQRPDNVVPPNIRRQRQMEKERASVRRLFSDNEDSEGRCHCVERFRRWHRRNAPNCNTCDDCVHGGNRPFFSYPYPFPYPYPYPPPYPPYCKR